MVLRYIILVTCLVLTLFIVQCTDNDKVIKYFGVELYPGSTPVTDELDSLNFLFPGCYAETLKSGIITYYGRYVALANFGDVFYFYTKRMGNPVGPKKPVMMNDKYIPPMFFKHINGNDRDLVKLTLVPNEKEDSVRIYINRTISNW
jgi:hypothetical protein